MNKVNKEIYKLVVEISGLLLFVIFSIFIWETMEYKSYAHVASFYANLKENTLSINEEVLMNRNIKKNTDNLAIFDDKGVIALFNTNNSDTKYELVLKIYNTNINPNEIKIMYNGEIKYLSNLEYYRYGEYYKFIIDEDYIKKNDISYYEVNMWIDNKSTVEMIKDVNYEFVVNEKKK